MRPYEDLTPRGQARRLRRLAVDALPRFGFGSYRLRLVKHLNNTTFRLTCDDGVYLVRVHGIERQPVRIESEVTWLRAIAEDTDLVVQAPRPTLDGGLVTVAEAPGVPDPRPVSVLTWVPGRVVLQSGRSRRHFTALGRTMATLHRHAIRWRPPPGFQRPTVDAEGLIGPASRQPLDSIAPSLPEPVRRDLLTTCARVKNAEAEVGRRRASFGLINCDLSFSNVLYHRGAANPIDFDEGGYGFYLFDLATALAGPWDGDDFWGRYEALLAGYREITPLPKDLTAHLPAFMGLRAACIILSAARRSPRHPWIDAQWQTRLRPYLEVGEFRR